MLAKDERKNPKFHFLEVKITQNSVLKFKKLLFSGKQSKKNPHAQIQIPFYLWLYFPHFLVYYLARGNGIAQSTEFPGSLRS